MPAPISPPSCDHYRFNTSLKLACRPPQGRALPAFACNRKISLKSYIYIVLHQQSIILQSCINQSTFLSAPLIPTWSETFLCCLVDIKEAPCRDISIQETCWHSYQTSKSLVSFWKGLTRVMEMLKGVLAPNITKEWEDMNMLWLKAWK